MDATTVIHELEDIYDWPPPVAKLADLLSQPLPSWLATGPYPFTSPCASDSIDLLSGYSTDHIVTTENYDSGGSTSLKVVFDLVMTASSDLRALSGRVAYGCPRPTIPIWITMLKHLFLHCSEHISILEDEYFVRPRAPHSQDVSSSGPITDGFASLIIAHYVDRADEDQDTGSACHSSQDSCTSSSSDDNSSHVRDENYGDNGEITKKRKANTSSSKNHSLKFPIHAHLLPTRGRHLSAVLPIIAVADEYNIIPLMSSMLYQRRVWHIDQPVIGIIFQGTGTVGQVLFGWLDHDSGTSGDLPGVHIACASPNSQPKASLGIFDLTDPVAAMTLAQFVLGLSSYFKDLINATSVTSVDADPSLHWRSDLIDISSESGEQWKERVSRWACDVHVSTCASSDTSSSPPRTPPLHTTRSQPSCWSPTMSSRNLHTIHEEGHDEPRGSKSLRSGVKRDGTQSDHKVSSDKSFSASQSSVAKQSVSKKSTKILSKSPAENQLSVDKYSASKKSKTNVSNSSFAMKSENGLDEELSITNWLFDRRALTIGRILLADLAQDPESEHKEINEKIKFYDETTKFCWPSSWKTLSDLPGSDLSIEGHRRMLFENYNNYVQAGNEVPDLETKIMELLSSRFSSMLSSSDGAYTRALAAAKRNSNEAERRHDWDNLLLKFFTTSKYTGSTNRDVLLERVLNAPRNIALDAMRTSAADHVRERSALARQYRLHCLAAYNNAVEQGNLDIDTHALQALNQSASFVEQVKGDIEARLLDALERRTNQEPTRGKCDAILVVPLEGVCAKIVKILGQSEGRKFVKNLALIAHPGAEKSASGTGKNDRANSDSARHLTVEPQPSSVTDNSKSTSYPSLHNVFTATVPRPPSESSETLSKDVVQLQAAQDGEIDNDLLLPVLTAEYKKKDVTTTFKALNQSRMYTVSALYFLRSLGIVDFPLFGLVTSGSEGAVSMAWYSSKQQKIFLMERNLQLYDISDPLQVYEFSVVLLRIAEHGQKLKVKLQEMLSKIDERSKIKTFKHWSNLAQPKEL